MKTPAAIHRSLHRPPMRSRPRPERKIIASIGETPIARLRSSPYIGGMRMADTEHAERPLVPLYTDATACSICGADGHEAHDCHLHLLLAEDERRVACESESEGDVWSVAA